MNRYYKVFSASGCALMLVFLTGCSGFMPNSNALRGAVFSKVRVPFTTDLKMTSTTNNAFSDKTIVVQEPFSGLGISAEVKSNAIGDIAKRNGLMEVYFADIESFSVLGIWTSETIYVYGERE